MTTSTNAGCAIINAMTGFSWNVRGDGAVDFDEARNRMAIKSQSYMSGVLNPWFDDFAGYESWKFEDRLVNRDQGDGTWQDVTCMMMGL